MVVAGGAVVMTAAGVLLWPKSTTPVDPVAVHFSELPKAVLRTGEYRGRQVRVAFYRAPVPTADPLVWHFHPGEPARVVPASYRLHFACPPPAFDTLPVVVVGTVDGIEADLTIRPSGVPGVLVIRGCSSVPPVSP